MTSLAPSTPGCPFLGPHNCWREHARECRNEKVKAKGYEARAPAEPGVSIAEHEEDDRGDSGNHAGKDSGHRDTFPVKAQYHAREELGHARVPR